MVVAELFARLGLKFDRRQWDKGRDRLGRFTKRTESKFAGLTKRIGGMFAGIVAGAGIARATKSSLDFGTALKRLEIASNGAIGPLDEFRAKVLSVSSSTGVAKEELIAGARAFTSLTGDGETAAKSMELFAKVSQSTGARIEDIAAAAGNISNNLGITANEMEKALSILVAGGKQGAVELSDMASLMADISAGAKRFAGGTGTQGLAQVNSFFQIVKEGAGSAEEARTRVKAFQRELVTNVDRLRKIGGVKAFEIDEEGNKRLRNFRDIIGDIAKSPLADDKEKLFKVFGAEGAEAIDAVLTKGVGAWDDLTQVTLESKATAEDYADFMSSAPAKISKAWNKFKIQMEKVFAVVVDGLVVLGKHWDEALIVLASLATAFVVVKGAAIAAAIASAAAWFVALAPFLLLAAAIALIILAVRELWEWFSDTSAFRFLRREFGRLLRAGEMIFEALVSAWHAVTGAVRDAWSSVVDFLRSKFQAFVDWIAGKFEWVADKAGDLKRIAGQGIGAIPFVDNPFAETPVSAGEASRVIKQAQSMNASINVQVPPGATADDVARRTRQEIETFWQRTVRQAEAGTGGV